MFIQIGDLMINWPSQIASFITTILLCYGYLQKDKIKYLFWGMLGSAVLVIEMVFILIGGVNAWAGVFSASISVIRNLIVLFFLTKKGREAPWWIGLIACAAMIGASIPFLNEWYSYIPMFASSLLTIALLFENYLVTNIATLILEVCYVIYNFMLNDIIGGIRECILLVAAIVSIVLFFVRKKKLEDNSIDEL